MLHMVCLDWALKTIGPAIQLIRGMLIMMEIMTVGITVQHSTPLQTKAIGMNVYSLLPELSFNQELEIYHLPIGWSGIIQPVLTKMIATEIVLLTPL